MDKEELRDRYEAFGDESVYAEAMRRYEDALAGPAEAAQEWRFIIGWCERNGDDIAADWPKRELHRPETHLADA
jgi:hypothetical protein